ncbi:MAG: PIN domain-containing protein [Clostridiales Family XIII bacterium]|nr:PIN domain-containing protein [Clostridiales Family XIII bacterium]
MKNKLYLDTSVVSALFDKRTPERMVQTVAAWEVIGDFDVFISEIVVLELERTPHELRSKLTEAIARFPVLPLTDEARELANEYVSQGIFPAKYYDDALHVSIASVNGIGVLLSWNFTHLVKMKTRRLVSLVNTMNDYPTVEIISPPEL